MSDALSQFSLHLSALVADAGRSLVAVHSHRSRSSGFAIGPGLIVTPDEALADEGEVTVTLPGGETRNASVAGRDPSTDVALLRVEGAVPVVTLGAARLPAAGAIVLAVAGAEGGSLASLGVVARSGPAWKSLRGGDIDARLELDLSLRRSAEGALALDADGSALGMAVFGPRRRVLVIPGSTIARVAGEIERHGRIRRGYLGLGLQPVRLDSGEGFGLMAVSVDQEGPAAAAGLAQGDVVTGWNGQPVPSMRELQRALSAQSVGSDVTLSYRRAGQAQEAKLTVGERPAA